MSRRFPALAALGLLLSAGTASAEFLGFGCGIGPAMYYGPYTGGHPYSYNVAYGYGFAFSSADTWWRDPLAYPAGPYAYPYGPYPPRRFFCPNAPVCLAADGAGAVVAGPMGLPLEPVPGAPQPALIEVKVPSGAEVWFEKNKTAQTGTQRIFRSPALPPGGRYVYTVRARWEEDGKKVEQMQAVGVQAGQTARVAFPAPRP
jgi:uncharacterized protein (TIGR03000 family)